MNRFIPALAAACFSLASVMAHAQTPPADGKGEHRKEMRENMKAAHEACKDKADKRACMTDSMCAKSPDPAKCQAGAKERHANMGKRMDERQKMHEACTGKRGEELGKCLHEQRAKSGHGQHDKKG